MRVSVLQDQLLRAIRIVTKAVDSRPTLPVLANILLVAEAGRLKLVATNLQVSITTHVGARVEVEGSITLPAKTFADLVNNLSPERVDLKLDAATQTVNLRCGMTNSNIKGIVATEFPPVPEEADADVVLNAGTLRGMIVQTAFSAAADDNRPILTGLQMQLEKNMLTLSGADGSRMAIRTAALAQDFGKLRTLVIPASALATLAGIISDEEKDIAITLPGKRDLILFNHAGTLVSSQLLEGKYPDLAGVIPKSYNTAVTVYTEDLLKALKRAEIFARDSHHSTRIDVIPSKGPHEPGALTVVGKSAERGDNEGTLDASVEGEGMYASFNSRYVIDALNAMPGERVTFTSNGAAAPGVFRPENGDDFICVIMPMGAK